MSLYDTLNDFSDAFLAKAKVRGAVACYCLLPLGYLRHQDAHARPPAPLP
jgi:hypothetical protein